jgi:hypothetical protein
MANNYMPSQCAGMHDLYNGCRPFPGSSAYRIVRGERFVHVADRREEGAYRDNLMFRELVDTSGIRASLSVALRKDETLLGMINVYRQEVRRPFACNTASIDGDELDIVSYRPDGTYLVKGVAAVQSSRRVGVLISATFGLLRFRFDPSP